MIYFQHHEFDCPTKKGTGELMEVKFLEMLDDARHIAGIPFYINSGYRTPEHNKNIGGSPNSSHMNFCAADVHCANGQDRLTMVHALIKVGFRRIGIADTFIHIDTDRNKPHSIWLY